MKIGTRGSQLALIQANLVKDQIISIDPKQNPEIIVIKTSGDIIQHKNLSDIGGKGLFIKELEEALLRKEVDIAVHSIKDIPAKLSERFILSAILEREDYRDAFISYNYFSPHDLPKNAVIGTSSIRRQVQMKKIRPDLRFVPFRGNVNTRLEKLKNNIVDATFLAVAGLKRMGLEAKIAKKMDVMEMIPSPSQGAIGIECLAENQAMVDLTSKLNHDNSRIIVDMERKFMQIVGGDCSTPIGALAEIKDNNIIFNAFIADCQGEEFYYINKKCQIANANEVAIDAGMEIIENVPDLIKRKECL